VRARVQPSAQAVDFGAQGFVFGLFALQKAAGERDFFQNALRGQHLDVVKFVFGLVEVLHLDPAFVDERIEAVLSPLVLTPSCWAISRWVRSGLSCSMRNTRK